MRASDSERRLEEQRVPDRGPLGQAAGHGRPVSGAQGTVGGRGWSVASRVAARTLKGAVPGWTVQEAIAVF